MSKWYNSKISTIYYLFNWLMQLDSINIQSLPNLILRNSFKLKDHKERIKCCIFAFLQFNSNRIKFFQDVNKHAILQVKSIFYSKISSENKFEKKWLPSLEFSGININDNPTHFKGMYQGVYIMENGSGMSSLVNLKLFNLRFF